MLEKTVEFMNRISVDALDQFADKLGLSSIFASVGLSVAQDVVDKPWVLTDYALLISAVGGVLFIIEKVFVIYLRYKESKKIAKAEKQKNKSRNLP